MFTAFLGRPVVPDGPFSFMANKILVERKTIDADGRERIELIDPREGASIKTVGVLAELEKRELRIATGRRILKMLGGWI